MLEVAEFWDLWVYSFIKFEYFFMHSFWDSFVLFWGVGSPITCILSSMQFPQGSLMLFLFFEIIFCFILESFCCYVFTCTNLFFCHWFHPVYFSSHILRFHFPEVKFQHFFHISCFFLTFKYLKYSWNNSLSVLVHKLTIYANLVCFWLIFLLLCVILTYFLAYLLIFDRMLDIVNLTLLGAGYICIPENSCLCSTSDYSERAWSSWFFLLRFVRWAQGSALMNYEIFHLAGGNKQYSLESFWLVLFLALGSFWIWAEAFLRLCWWHSADSWGGSLWRPPCPVNCSCLCLLRFSAPSAPCKEHPGSVSSPACTLVEKLSQAAIWGNHRVNTLPLRDPCSLLPGVQCLLLHIFVHPWPASGQTANPGPAAPSSPIEEVSISNTCNLFPPSLSVRCT